MPDVLTNEVGKIPSGFCDFCCEKRRTRRYTHSVTESTDEKGNKTVDIIYLNACKTCVETQPGCVRYRGHTKK